MLERSATPAQNISKISTWSTQVRHISGDHAVRVLWYDMKPEERITYLKNLWLEKLVDINNTLYTQIMNRDPIGIHEEEAVIEQEVSSLLRSNKLVIVIWRTVVNCLGTKNQQQINFLGISSPQITQY